MKKQAVRVAKHEEVKGEVWASGLRLVVVVPDEQGDARESYDKFESDDEDVLHNG